MILTVYYVHSFLLAAILAMIFLIGYFNYIAITTKTSNRVVEISGLPPKCQYEDLNVISDKQQCTKGENKNLFYKTLDKITYSLSTKETNYLTVCKTLCQSFDDLSKDCKGTKIQINNFNNCVNNLKTDTSCKGLERPLGFRYNKNNRQEKVNFYAKEIIQINNCI